MSNLHGILNNLVNELTESSSDAVTLPTLGIDPTKLTNDTTRFSYNDTTGNIYRSMTPEQQAAEEEAGRAMDARVAENLANDRLALQHSLGQRTQADLEMDKYAAEQQAAHQREMDRLTDPGLLARMKSEVVTHPWLYGGLGAAALASGAGALALRKRLAKTKNQ